MTLGLNRGTTDGGDFLPIIKYNAEAGRLFQVERSPTSDGSGKWMSKEIELQPPVLLVFDFGSVEVGWMLFVQGQAPSRAMVPFGERMPDQPSPEHRDGFRMKVWNPNLGVREFGSNSKMLNTAVDDLHTLFEHAPEAVEGLLPVVRFTGTMQIKGKMKSTFYRPLFEIVRWVERSADFGPRIVPPPLAKEPVGMTAPQAPYVPPQAARHAPPPGVSPAAAPSVAAAMAAESEWGGGGAGAGSAGMDDDLDDEIPF